MALHADDRIVISELISLHGHLCDEGQLDRLDELFTDDVVYDVTDFGQEPLTGVEAIRAAAITLGDANPVGHHVTNIVLKEEATARCTPVPRASESIGTERAAA
ncbi:nuclear transport factor 2 family protein [Streptomyces aureus]